MRAYSTAATYRRVSNYTVADQILIVIRRKAKMFRKKMQYRWFRTLIVQWCVAGLAALLLSLFFFGMIFTRKVNAEEDSTVYYKYYQNTVIQKNDTLWKYAEEYSAPGQDARSYIQEVEFINQLDGKGLVAGKSITLPYYSTEYICSK